MRYQFTCQPILLIRLCSVGPKWSQATLYSHSRDPVPRFDKRAEGRLLAQAEPLWPPLTFHRASVLGGSGGSPHL